MERNKCMGLLDKFKKKQETTEPPAAGQEPSTLRVGFVLLETPAIDWDALINYLHADWDISVAGKPADDGPLMFEHDRMTVALMFVAAPILDQEAENNARNNFLWPEAAETVARHQAQIIFSVLQGADRIAVSLLYTKVAAALLKLDNALALYQTPTVISAADYQVMAEDIKLGELPVYAWVYVGLYHNDTGASGYTAGLEYFGKKEIEVLQTIQTPEDLFGFLYNIARYVIENDISLKDGETIGFSAEQKLPITLSKGVAIENDSFKIKY